MATAIVVAALAVVFSPTGETGAAPAALLLRQLMASMGLAFLTFRATAGAVDCNPIPVPRRGGDEQHNACANTISSNEHVGFDVCMSLSPRTKRFDGKSGRILWEAKTYNMNNQRPPYFIIAKDIPDSETKASPIARGCGYAYKWWVGDPRVIPAIETVYPSFIPKVADGIEVAQVQPWVVDGVEKAPNVCIQPDK